MSSEIRKCESFHFVLSRGCVGAHFLVTHKPTKGLRALPRELLSWLKGALNTVLNQATAFSSRQRSVMACLWVLVLALPLTGHRQSPPPVASETLHLEIRDSH